jgi:hypothetical protein
MLQMQEMLQQMQQLQQLQQMQLQQQQQQQHDATMRTAFIKGTGGAAAVADDLLPSISMAVGAAPATAAPATAATTASTVPTASAAPASAAESTAAVDALTAKVEALEKIVEDLKSVSTKFYGKVGVPRAFVYLDYKEGSKPVSKICAGEWVALSYPMVYTERKTDAEGTTTDTWLRCYSINPSTMNITAFWVNTATNGTPTFDSVKFYPH